MAFMEVLWGAAIVGTISYNDAVRASGLTLGYKLEDGKGTDGCRGEADVRTNVGCGFEVGPTPFMYGCWPVS